MPASLFKKIAVVGAGPMGRQIAAHVAYAGFPVLLLGRKRPAAIDETLFVSPDDARLVSYGDQQSDLRKLGEVDWIIEAVTEDAQVKSDVYKKIDSVRKSDSIVSSTTASLPLSTLVRGQNDKFATDFLLTHFFSPVRSKRLVELVTGYRTHAEIAEMVGDFCDRRLGKRVIRCNDTPGYIANRLFLFFLQAAARAAMRAGLTVEEADEVCNAIMGFPKTGLLGLIDEIGLEAITVMEANLSTTLPESDPYRAAYGATSLFWKEATAERSVKPKIPAVIAAGKNLQALCGINAKYGSFAWRVLSETLVYAVKLVPQTAADVSSVDEAMRLAYGWRMGPFEMMDSMGPDGLARRIAGEGRMVPAFLNMSYSKPFYRGDETVEYLDTDGIYRTVSLPTGVLSLTDIKRVGKPIERNGSANLWDIGDGVQCLEMCSKSNAIDLDILSMIGKAKAYIGNGRGIWRGLVLYNEGEDFSFGLNLTFLWTSIKNARWELVEDYIKRGQDVCRALRFASFPTVAALSGTVRGGACELALHCSAAQSYAETTIGITDGSLGLIPAWGGCAQLLGRAYSFKASIPPVSRVFDIIGTSREAGSTKDAIECLYRLPADGLTMNRDRLLYDAKQHVLDLAKDYQSPKPWQVNPPSYAGRSALDLAVESLRRLGKITAQDALVLKALASVLCGGASASGTLTEDAIMDLERQEFMNLVRMPETLERIEKALEIKK